MLEDLYSQKSRLYEPPMIAKAPPSVTVILRRTASILRVTPF